MPLPETVVRATGLSKTYGRRVVLDDVTFTAAPGETVALTGPSGAGKSTALACLGGLERVTRGSVVVDGQDVTRLSPRGRRLLRRDTLGFLFQGYALVENETLATNVSFAVAARGARRSSRAVSVSAALDRVGLGGREDEPTYQLSGGEQQRVALARLLVKAPPVVLADEPTAALDTANEALVLALLRELADGGTAVVLATHSDVVLAGCDTEVRLDGRGASRQPHG